MVGWRMKDMPREVMFTGVLVRQQEDWEGVQEPSATELADL